MTGSSSKQPSDSSTPLFKGTPEFIGYFEHLISNFQTSVVKAIEQIAKEEQESIRQVASASDTGWSDLSSQITVQYSSQDKELKYSVDTKNDTETYKVQTLEFGDQNNPATGLLRSRANRSRDGFQNRVVDLAHSIAVKGQ
jgi:predicted RNA-binding protein with RPS1 domain